jgi:hypothetical protein
LKISGETHDQSGISNDSEQELDNPQELEAGASLPEGREQLIGELIHEFTNTVTAVIGYSELALHTIEEFHPAREWLEKTRRHASELGFY